MGQGWHLPGQWSCLGPGEFYCRLLLCIHTPCVAHAMPYYVGNKWHSSGRTEPIVVPAAALTMSHMQGAQEDVAAVMHHSGCLADAQVQLTLTTAEQQKGSVQASAVIAATPEAAWLQQVSCCP